MYDRKDLLAFFIFDGRFEVTYFWRMRKP